MVREINVERRRSAVGSATIAYQVAGAGEPVVLLHGLSGSCRWWDRNIAALAQHFRVYVVDLLGFGDSRGRAPFELHQAAALLVRWMDLLDIERASLVGHSMGGYIAADLAADFAGRVERLALVDAVAFPLAGQIGRLMNVPNTMRSLPLHFLPVLLGDAWRAGPLTISRAAFELLTSDLRPKLGNIRAPSIVLWGEHDTLLPLELGRQLCRAVPTTRELVIVKNAGHNPMWDCPRAFNAVLTSFLRHGYVADGLQRNDVAAGMRTDGRPPTADHRPPTTDD